MGKASSSKKVSRVARTGGGRTGGGGGQSRSLLFPAVVAVAVILGVFLVGFSRAQRQPDTSPPQPGDHWHAAIGFFICDQFAPDIPDNGNDPFGIHGHGDGVVHAHPFSSIVGGSRAKLGVYFEAVGIDVSSSRIEIPTDTRENGDDCDGGSGSVQTRIWDTRSASDQGRLFNGDPAELRITDNMLVTVAFVADGTEIPKPPSEAQLDNLSDVPGATTTTLAGSTTLPETTTTTPAVTTTVDGGSSTTTAP